MILAGVERRVRIGFDNDTSKGGGLQVGSESLSKSWLSNGKGSVLTYQKHQVCSSLVLWAIAEVRFPPNPR